MEYEIIHLPKESWKGTILPMGYTTYEYYDVSVEKTDKGYGINIEKKGLDKPITHTSEEYNFPDRLYADHWENAFAWGVIVDGELIAAIETDIEAWSNRLRITEVWVSEKYRKHGIGHALIEVAKEQARLEHRRAIILETQSCNVNAIGFYRHEGFSLIGMDICCYSNNDIKRKEVRLEFGWFPEKKRRLSRNEIEIRMEKPEDWYDVELMTQRAFWNKHHMGCDEHYLVHKIRQHEDYIPELSRVAVKDGAVIGCIMYTKARVVSNDKVHDILSFGPLCIDPKWQGCGVGEMLLKTTMNLAADKGYKAIVIYGEPDYYPRIGFKTCDNYNITTADCKNFDAFMGIELKKDSLKGIEGRFYESEVYKNLPKEAVEEFNRKFPPLRKIKFPCHWS